MNRPMRICLIDDQTTSLAVLKGVLSRDRSLEIEGFRDADAALERLDETVFDLVLVDFRMPKMDGMEVVRALRATDTYQTVPIIMVTADNDRHLRLEAIEAGATDFLTKPVDPQELRMRVQNLLMLRDAQLSLADRARLLSAEVAKATAQLAAREEELIRRLAHAIDSRDGATGEHVSRVADISQIIARNLGCGDECCRLVYLAAPLHDTGKIGIPDAILLKPGPLNDEEWQIMRRHTVIGGDILANGDTELIRVAEQIALSHHERWDGTGYPLGLAGEEIPLVGRIVAVADVFDALCSARPYKRPWTLDEARAEIEKQSGRHFDPNCVTAFTASWPEVVALFDATRAPTGPSPLPQRRIA